MGKFASALVISMLLSVPVFAQIDLSGDWSPVIHEDAQDRTGGPDLGDYTGLPINDAARLRADSWEATMLSLPEWQCRPHPIGYITHGPSTLRLWKEVSPVSRQVVAWHAEWLRSQDRPIYMDGRPHPPEDAPHTWMGFSTAKWEGDMLSIETTHLKEGYIRRNGLPISDLTTMSEHLIRHGDFLSWVTIITDPVYLTEPLIRTQEYALNLRGQLNPNPCSASDIGQEVVRPKGSLPHHLPGTNPFLTEFATQHQLPMEAVRGGAETLYPEYPSKFKGPASVNASPKPKASTTDIRAQQVRGNVYMLSGTGGNITVLIGTEGVMLVDAGTAQISDKVLEAIRKLSDKPVRYIINTGIDADHTGGNQKIAETGGIITGGTVFANAGETAAIIAHENVLLRMSNPAGRQPAVSATALPTDTFVNDGKKFSPSVQGEPIQILYEPAAHTDGDAIVFFRHSDVISTGDIFLTTGYPVIDVERGGSIHGIIDSLNHILDLAIPDAWMEGGTMVIPGHGRLCDSADVAYYRDMLTIIRDRVQDMIKKGMTVQQVKAAKPTRDYDPRYGGNANWTPDMFLDAVYQTLQKRK